MQGALNPPNPLLVVLALLAVWRVTYLLQAEDGPFGLLGKLRERAGEGFVGRLLGCFDCLSLWIALPFAWLISGIGWELLLVWLGLSGGAILADRLTASREVVHLPFLEEEESSDAVLRTPQSNAPAE